MSDNMGKPTIDMDGLGGSSGCLPSNPVERWRRTFERHGLKCVEIVWQSHGNTSKMVWCLEPFESVDVAGKANPLFHMDFTEGDERADGNEDRCRELVRAEFDAWWSDGRGLTVKEHLSWIERKSVNYV